MHLFSARTSVMVYPPPMMNRKKNTLCKTGAETLINNTNNTSFYT